jgi:hypothetical protein
MGEDRPGIVVGMNQEQAAIHPIRLQAVDFVIHFAMAGEIDERQLRDIIRHKKAA